MCVQIFQICLKGTKWILFDITFYHSSTCRRKANILKKHLSNNIERKKGTSWTLLNCSNICMKQLVHRYLQNNICYFRSRISPWRGPQLKLLFWAFFLVMVYIFTMQKNQPLLRPPSTFSEHLPLLASRSDALIIAPHRDPTHPTHPIHPIHL